MPEEESEEPSAKVIRILYSFCTLRVLLHLCLSARGFG